MKKILIAILAAATLFTACKKEVDTPDYNENDLTAITVEFDNIVGGQNLILNNSTYFNKAGENYKINLLQYFVSNFKFGKADGSFFTVNQDSSYFLIKASDRNTRFATIKVPEGDYTTLIFTLGVDSLRNAMDITRRTGVLDPSGGMDDGMYWGWNPGYIFLKMEGTSESAPLDPTGQRKFRYHIGGFGGYSVPTINNIKTLTIDLRNRGIAQVRKNRKANIHLFTDIDKVLSGKNTISIAANPNVMFSTFSTTVADNFMELFTHDHTEN